MNMGSTQIGQLYAGGVEIAQAYLGSNKVFEKQSPAPVTVYEYKLSLSSGQTEAYNNITIYNLLVGGNAAQLTSGDYATSITGNLTPLNSTQLSRVVGTDGNDALTQWAIGLNFYFLGTETSPSVSFRCASGYAPTMSMRALLYKRLSGSSDPWTTVTYTSYTQSPNLQVTL